MLPVVNDTAGGGRNASILWDRTALTPCNIVFISDKINTRVVSNSIELLQKTVKIHPLNYIYYSVHSPPGGSTLRCESISLIRFSVHSPYVTHNTDRHFDLSLKTKRIKCISS